MRVAIVHDDLVQWGGAERVLLTIAEVFPEAAIFTSVFDQKNKILKEKLKGKVIKTSFLQKIPGWRYLYKALLPLYPIAFEQFNFDEFDLVVSQTTRFAKVVLTKPQTRHVCYCHTPPRFLWGFTESDIAWYQKILKPYFYWLRIYDKVTANRVDCWIAGSFNCQRRITEIYEKESQVLQPFVDDRFFKAEEGFDGGYYLVVCRLNKFKRVDIAIKAFNKLKLPLKIVGEGPQRGEYENLALDNIEFLGSLSDKMLLNLMAGCRALIVTAEEDFGLTPVEAQAMGKPVIAFGRGGTLESIIEGKTGLVFEKQNETSLIEAINRFDKMKFEVQDSVENAKRFSKERFKKQLESLVKV